MSLKPRRNYPVVMLPAALLLIMGMSGCAENKAAARDETVALQDMVLTTTEGAETDTIARPGGWSEETHGNEAEPNYEVVFPDDRVNQITITIAPEDWEAMQANMVDLFGEAGSGEGGGGFPGGFGRPEGAPPQPGTDRFPEGFQPPAAGERAAPPEGAPPQPGAEGFPDGFQPPEGWDQAAPPEIGPAGGRPGEGGFRGGDMTPENPVWVPATIEFEGNTWTNVGVRYKGNSSLTSGWRSGTLKLPLKLDFDEFEDDHPEIDDQRFYGFKQLSLANGFSDSSFLRDAVTSGILAEAGLPAAETSFYEVVLDYGEGPVTLGLYSMIEVVDDTVVERYFGSDDGNIYEADGPAASFAASSSGQIEQSFQKENNEGEADWSDIEALFYVLNDDQRISDPAAWRADLESIFDVDGFLEWLAISAVIEHWDAYGNMSHNYYLYHDPDSGQLKWISWDHNMVMSAGMAGRGGRGPGTRRVSLDKADVNDNWPLIRYLLDDTVYYTRYLDYLEETVAGPFDPGHMAETCQAMADLIAPYAIADVGEASFDAAVQQLIERAYQRADAVEEFLTTP
jgi:spore coat protein H